MKSGHDNDALSAKTLKDRIAECELILQGAKRVGESRDERIWAAGFFDGEGYVAALKEGITCEIDQIEEDLINLVRFRNAVGAGTIVATKPRSNENSRPVCRWRISSQANLQTVFDMIGEFLNPAKMNGRPVQKKDTASPPSDGFARALASPYRAILSRREPKLPPGASMFEPISDRKNFEEE